MTQRMRMTHIEHLAYVEERALRAISQRYHGVFDGEELKSFGPLTTNTAEDMAFIAEETIYEKGAA